MPIPGFRVVLPLLLCLLVIDPVCSTRFSIKLQMDPQSVEASLHYKRAPIVEKSKTNRMMMKNTVNSVIV